MATSLNNLAELYRAQRPVRRGRAALQALAGDLGEGPRPGSSRCGQSLNNLAVLYDAKAKYEEAEPLFKRSLAIREKALGPDHPDVATSLNNLTLLYRATKREKEAEELEARAARIRSIKLTCPPHKDPASVIMFGDSSRLRPGGSTRT